MLRATFRKKHTEQRQMTYTEHGGHITYSEVQALPMSCFHLPMSTDSFLVMSLQIHVGVYVYLFNAQNV